jgi:hypothetical protein
LHITTFLTPKALNTLACLSKQFYTLKHEALIEYGVKQVSRAAFMPVKPPASFEISWILETFKFRQDSLAFHYISRFYDNPFIGVAQLIKRTQNISLAERSVRFADDKISAYKTIYTELKFNYLSHEINFLCRSEDVKARYWNLNQDIQTIKIYLIVVAIAALSVSILFLKTLIAGSFLDVAMIAGILCALLIIENKIEFNHEKLVEKHFR